MENKRYYVDFYDMFDGWGTWGFCANRLFDDFEEAKTCANILQSELDKANRLAGEHYGVIDKKKNREIYCTMDKEYTESLKKDIDKIFGEGTYNKLKDIYTSFRIEEDE